MSQSYRLIVGADLAEVVKAKQSMGAVWAIVMALARTEKPYMKKFQFEVLNECLRDVDAGLEASHRHFLKMVNGDGES